MPWATTAPPAGQAAPRRRRHDDRGLRSCEETHALGLSPLLGFAHERAHANPIAMVSMLSMLLATAVTSTTAFISIDTSPFFYSDLMASRLNIIDRAPPSPSWRCTESQCAIAYGVQHLEADSLRLTLGDDGKTITLSGERKIEGCQCQPRDDVIISLPFTPSAPDALSSSIDKAERLTITLSKHAKMPEPKTISIKRQMPEATETNEIHFVPHESATGTAAEEKMKEAFDKFRAVAALAHKDDNKEQESNAAVTNETANTTAGE